MYDKIKDIYKNIGEDEFVLLTGGIDSSLLGIYGINKKGQVKRISDGKIFKAFLIKNRYPIVRLRKSKSKSYDYMIHRLLALTFIENPEPNTHTVVDHINRNIEDFSLSNLRWTSVSENNKNRSFKENSFKKYAYWISKDKKSFSKIKPKNSTSWTKYLTNEPNLFDKYDFPEDWKLIPNSKGKGIYCSSSGLILFTSKYNYITSGSTNRQGYKTVKINGKTKLIHRLVYLLFSGDSDIENYFIDHVNTITVDNRLENLKKVSQKENMNNSLTKQKISKPIALYNLEGTYIKKFSSAMEAAKELGLGLYRTGIYDCCRGKLKNHGGYQFRYIKENQVIPGKIKPVIRDTTSKSVLQFSLTGVLIKKYASMKEASMKLGLSISGISRCCQGKQKTYKGYIWKYKDDENNSDI